MAIFDYSDIFICSSIVRLSIPPSFACFFSIVTSVPVSLFGLFGQVCRSSKYRQTYLNNKKKKNSFLKVLGIRNSPHISYMQRLCAPIEEGNVTRIWYEMKSVCLVSPDDNNDNNA